MNPKSLKTLLVTSDTVFSREIKQTILRDEAIKIVDEQLEHVKQQQLEIKQKACSCLSYNEILVILEQLTGHYWIYMYEERIYLDFRDKASFEKEARNLICEENLNYILEADDPNLALSQDLDEYYVVTVDTWVVLCEILGVPS